MSSDAIRDRLNSVQLGEIVVAPWGDAFTWTENCIRPSQLETGLGEADPICDATLASLYDSATHRPVSHNDLLSSIQLSSHPQCISFVNLISSSPPTPIAASASQLVRGRNFFTSYSIPILQSLLHMSLACGLASPQISRTLRQVSHLIPPPPTVCPFFRVERPNSHNSRIVGRLLETVQFVVDICGNDNSHVEKDLDSPWKGEAWKSAVRVRMLHAFVRRRICSRRFITPDSHGIVGIDGGDVNVVPAGGPHQFSRYTVGNEIPINQAELAITLASFCVVPLLGLQRLGFNISSREKNDFVALWRHYGWYLGISATILERHFASFDKANAFMCSVATWMLAGRKKAGAEEIEFGGQPAPVAQILWALSNNTHVPYYSFKASCALTRELVGSSMADDLGLPKTSPWAYWKMKVGITITNGPIYLGESGIGPLINWNERRKSLMNFIVPTAIAWSLGWQRTKFAPSIGTERFTPFPTYEQTVSPMFLLCYILFRWIILHAELLLILALPLIPLLVLNHIPSTGSLFGQFDPSSILPTFATLVPNVSTPSPGLSLVLIAPARLFSFIFYRFN